MKKFLPVIVFALLLGAACSRPEPARPKHLLEVGFLLPGATKVTDNHFDPADRVGLWITESPAPLQVSGNYANNVAMNYNGTGWTPSFALYWPEGDSPLDIYACYPYHAVSSVTADPYLLPQDQREGYSQADLLWAGIKDCHRTSQPVQLRFSHCLSRVTVRLVKGEHYSGELPRNAEVFLHSTITEGFADYSTGSVTKDDRVTMSNSIRMHPLSAEEFDALVIPQRLSNRTPLLEIVGEGISYLAEGTFNFLPGTHHILTVILNTSPQSIEITIGTSIGEDWN